MICTFGGKENDYNERPGDGPPFRVKRDIATAIRALAATALKLAEYDKATGSEDEKSLFGTRPTGSAKPGPVVSVCPAQARARL